MNALLITAVLLGIAMLATILLVGAIALLAPLELHY
jgi:hypothetical protein